MQETIKFNSRKQFHNWLKKSTSIVLLGLSLSQGAIEAHSSWHEATSLIRQAQTQELPKAKYTVYFERAQKDKKDKKLELKNIPTMLAICYKYEPFKVDQISKIEIILKTETYITLDKSDSSTQTFIIALPGDLIQAEKLKMRLRSTGAFIAEDHGSGFMENIYCDGKMLPTKI